MKILSTPLAVFQIDNISVVPAQVAIELRQIGLHSIKTSIYSSEAIVHRTKPRIVQEDPHQNQQRGDTDAQG